MVALSDYTPRKPLTVVTFAVLVVLATTTFALTEAGHLGQFQRGDVTGTVTEYHLTETAEGPIVVATIEVENPLLRPIQLTTTELTGLVGGDKVATDDAAFLDMKVPPGGSKTVTVRFEPTDGDQTRMYSAAKSESLVISGVINAKIERAKIDVDVDTDLGSQSAVGVPTGEHPGVTTDE